MSTPDIEIALLKQQVKTLEERLEKVEDKIEKQLGELRFEMKEMNKGLTDKLERLSEVITSAAGVAKGSTWAVRVIFAVGLALSGLAGWVVSSGIKHP
ncbi:hypothetical protein LXA47_31425 [Massilia sp. P8910]|uniref:DUF5320 domain-containing protein n=1 Tax=Massilia antarctica TaxID=2765360 RepID=UPI001E38CE2A|nr:DUF5320 domain-containing protein [Massilia antarctica]MCE3608083.1 hypothetical protein [Massilia antarctica]